MFAHAEAIGVLTCCRCVSASHWQNFTERRSTSGKDKTERCFLQNKSSSLASSSTPRPNDSPESARVTQMLTDRCFYLLSERKSKRRRLVGGDRCVCPALVRKCRISAATVRKHRDTELHEQPLFPHRDTTKLGVRASMSNWKRYESTDNSRKSVFPQLWI